jgi:hypothetical protein
MLIIRRLAILRLRFEGSATEGIYGKLPGGKSDSLEVGLPPVDVDAGNGSGFDLHICKRLFVRIGRKYHRRLCDKTWVAYHEWISVLTYWLLGLTCACH